MAPGLSAWTSWTGAGGGGCWLQRCWCGLLWLPLHRGHLAGVHRRAGQVRCGLIFCSCCVSVAYVTAARSEGRNGQMSCHCAGCYGRLFTCGHLAGCIDGLDRCGERWLLAALVLVWVAVAASPARPPGWRATMSSTGEACGCVGHWVCCEVFCSDALVCSLVWSASTSWTGGHCGCSCVRCSAVWQFLCCRHM